MILTCPTCASQYSLDDAKLAERPRTVRCASCKSTWTATMPEPAAEKSPPKAAPTPSPEPAPRPSAAAASAPEAESAGAAEQPFPSPAEMPLPLAYRAKVTAKAQTREAVAAGMVWGGLGAALVALLAAAALFRVDVVRLWPRTAGAYAKVGLPVNPLGLAPENVEAGTGLVNGQAAVVVTGQLRNIQTRPNPAQPLRIVLLDKDGKRLAEQVAQPAPGPIPPNGVRSFSAQFIDPPAEAKDVEVEFAFDLMSASSAATHKVAPHASEPIKQHAPAPEAAHAAAAPPAMTPLPAAKAAEPLPDQSPYALPKAATENNPQQKHDG